MLWSDGCVLRKMPSRHSGAVLRKNVAGHFWGRACPLRASGMGSRNANMPTNEPVFKDLRCRFYTFGLKGRIRRGSPC